MSHTSVLQDVPAPEPEKIDEEAKVSASNFFFSFLVLFCLNMSSTDDSKCFYFQIVSKFIYFNVIFFQSNSRTYLTSLKYVNSFFVFHKFSFFIFKSTQKPIQPYCDVIYKGGDDNKANFPFSLLFFRSPKNKEFKFESRSKSEKIGKTPKKKIFVFSFLSNKTTSFLSIRSH